MSPELFDHRHPSRPPGRPPGPRRRPRHAPSWALAGLLIILTAACRKPPTRFEILCFRNPEAPERIAEDFDTGFFSVNAQADWDIVFEIPPSYMEIEVGSDSESEATSAPSEDGPVVEDDSAVKDTPVVEDAPPAPQTDQFWLAQLLHINVFWLPHPGKTNAESTQTNATIEYCLLVGGQVISYQGAGFVYFKQSRDGQTITGRIESATLTPTGPLDQGLDLFGPSRIQGTFTARRDRRQVVALLRRLHRSLGPQTATSPSPPPP